MELNFWDKRLHSGQPEEANQMHTFYDEDGCCVTKADFRGNTNVYS
jgi:hypothetical protein